MVASLLPSSVFCCCLFQRHSSATRNSPEESPLDLQVARRFRLIVKMHLLALLVAFEGLASAVLGALATAKTCVNPPVRKEWYGCLDFLILF